MVSWSLEDISLLTLCFLLSFPHSELTRSPSLLGLCFSDCHTNPLDSTCYTSIPFSLLWVRLKQGVIISSIQEWISFVEILSNFFVQPICPPDSIFLHLLPTSLLYQNYLSESQLDCVQSSVPLPLNMALLLFSSQLALFSPWSSSSERVLFPLHTRAVDDTS